MQGEKVNRRVSVVDFFSGCGGTSAGLRAAGFDILAGIDIDTDAAASFQKNFPSAHFFEQDIRDLTTERVGEILPDDSALVFAGCAPCQPFSQHQKYVDNEDPRRSLLLEFLRFVLALEPDYVLVENVPGLQRLSTNEGPLGTFTGGLESAGYNVTSGILRASDYGVPQIRKRFVLLAAKNTAVDFPAATHGEGLLPISTVEDWISGLPELAAGEVDPSDPQHVAARLSELNLERIQSTLEGGGRENWPERLLPECHKKYNGHTDVYGRLSWDKPAAALTTRCISYSNGRFGHPKQDRALSVREAALLQTFPATHQFEGPLTSRARQIGNAVPPLLARVLGEQILGAELDV